MTPEFGAASQLEKIDMLDFAEFVAINKFDRKGALPTPCATSPSRCSATAKPSPRRPTRCRCSAPWPPASTTTASPRCTRPCCRRPAGAGPATWRKAACRGRDGACASSNQTPIVPPRARATWPRSPTPCAATKPAPAQARLARELQQLRETARMLQEDEPEQDGRAVPRATVIGPGRMPRRAPGQRRAQAAGPVARHAKAYAGDEYVVKIRDKEIRTALTTKSCRHHHPQRWPCRSSKTTAKSSSG